jgi:hypothetical protein
MGSEVHAEDEEKNRTSQQAPGCIPKFSIPANAGTD